MRNTGTCSKCSSRQLAVVVDYEVPDHRVTNGTRPLTVVARSRSMEPRVQGGTFDLWMCTRCGYSEWYAKNALATLQELARQGRGVYFVNGPEPGPQR